MMVETLRRYHVDILLAIGGDGTIRAATPDVISVRASKGHFVERRERVTLKYIDPSYLLRGRRSTSEDAVFCDALARNAVHAAMAGKTDILVGRWHGCFTHVPLAAVISHRKEIDPRGELWRDVLESTGQPSFV